LGGHIAGSGFTLGDSLGTRFYFGFQRQRFHCL
jgi:hypothetical protein